MREEDFTPEERARHMRNLARNMAEGGARRRRKRTTAADDQKSDPFVKVPLRWATQVARATRSPGTMVWIWLLYLAWGSGARTVPLANAKLKQWGVSRNVKWRVLRDLEKADLVVIERRPRRAPLITLTDAL